jgi:hypothetical protein
MLKTFENSSMTTIIKQSMSSRHHWDQLSNLWNLNKNSEYAPHCSFITMCPPTSPKTTEFVTNDNTIIIPHAPYLPDLTPTIFLCFTKWKWNWRDDVLKQCLISKGHCKRYLRAFRKITSRVLLKRGLNDGITAYVSKETTLKEMAAKISFSQHFFFIKSGNFLIEHHSSTWNFRDSVIMTAEHRIQWHAL